jgi:hypothetical protein
MQSSVSAAYYVGEQAIHISVCAYSVSEQAMRSSAAEGKLHNNVIPCGGSE